MDYAINKFYKNFRKDHIKEQKLILKPNAKQNRNFKIQLFIKFN